MPYMQPYANRQFVGGLQRRLRQLIDDLNYKIWVKFLIKTGCGKYGRNVS